MKIRGSVSLDSAILSSSSSSLENLLHRAHVLAEASWTRCEFTTTSFLIYFASQDFYFLVMVVTFVGHTQHVDTPDRCLSIKWMTPSSRIGISFLADPGANSSATSATTERRRWLK